MKETCLGVFEAWKVFINAFLKHLLATPPPKLKVINTFATHSNLLNFEKQSTCYAYTVPLRVSYMIYEVTFRKHPGITFFAIPTSS